jgi:hypothetical protein
VPPVAVAVVAAVPALLPEEAVAMVESAPRAGSPVEVAVSEGPERGPRALPAATDRNLLLVVVAAAAGPLETATAEPSPRIRPAGRAAKAGRVSRIF